MRRHDSARVVAPRVGCKSPRDRSPQSATVRSDTTKNHGAAFRPDIFQLHVNMIGGRRSCKSPPRRCSQCAHHTAYVRTYTYKSVGSCIRPRNAYAIERSDVRVRVWLIDVNRRPRRESRRGNRPAFRWHVDSRFTRAEIPRRAGRNLCVGRARRSRERNVYVARDGTAVKRGCNNIVCSLIARFGSRPTPPGFRVGVFFQSWYHRVARTKWNLRTWSWQSRVPT